jgi:hypothetical protein
MVSIIAYVPLQMIISSSSKELSAYARAGSIATEVFSCIKTVLVFNGQDKECERYGHIALCLCRFSLKP